MLGGTLRYLLLILVLLAGCNDQLDRPIRIVVPPSFSGPIGILANPSFPDQIVKQTDAYVITVPADGLVRTSSLDVFHKWHETEFVDTAGNPITDVAGGQSMSGLGIPGTIIWFYRGPKHEHDAFMYGPGDTEQKREWLESRGVTENAP